MLRLLQAKLEQRHLTAEVICADIASSSWIPASSWR